MSAVITCFGCNQKQNKCNSPLSSFLGSSDPLAAVAPAVMAGLVFGDFLDGEGIGGFQRFMWKFYTSYY